MKKIFKLFIILIFPILLCSCNNNENLEGKLVEISSIELTNNFYDEDWARKYLEGRYQPEFRA